MAGRNQDGDASAVAMADDMARLKALSDVAIDEVATPDAGVLTAEEAWTISAEPSKVRIGSGAAANAPISAPSLSSPFPTKAQPAAPSQVDTGAIERLVATRMDTIEDSMKAMEIRLLETLPQLVEVVSSGTGEASDDAESSEEEEVESSDLDTIVTADGEVIQSGSMEVSPDMESSEKQMESLMELYEAQALALNPFLANPGNISEQLNERNAIGPHMLAALLLDNLTGMGAASFTRKAISSKLLSDAEGSVLLSIVELAEPGDPDSALSDALPNRALLTFITLLESWRNTRQTKTEG